METRLKERLTGAAILVALIVLVVPELFHGQRPDIAANTSSSGEGPPVRSYTIDLSNGPARTAPLQSTDNGAAAATAPAPAPTAPATATTTAPVATPSMVPPPVTPPPAAPAPKPKPSAAPASEPSRATKSASATSWSVQLGLFASHDNAERLAHSAQGKGFQVSVSDADGKGLYHVVAGGLADRAAAQTLQGRLQGAGFQAAVVAPQSGNLKSAR